MGELSPLNWLSALAVLYIFLAPWLAYRHGRKVGDQQGYIRGYQEGQQSGKQS